MAEASIESRGHLVAMMLTGSWRCPPKAFDCTAMKLEEITPLLLSSGAAALSWRRVRDSDLRATTAANQLHQAYRRNILQGALRQETIEKVIKLLRDAGVEPILVKGWAVARLYTEMGLRPCGDIDLCVRPEEFDRAEAALADLKEHRLEVDLHCGFSKFGGGSAEGFYERSRLVRLLETEVRVLSEEDHLRVLAVHMLREGAWRPLWLCDVAAAVESRRADFDWGYCLGQNRRWSNWVTCALRLARELLGADVGGTPAAVVRQPLPRWLVQAILKEWGSPFPSMKQRHRAPMAHYWRHPSGVFAGLRHRWPNPIEATISLGGSFNRMPRFPYQVGSYLAYGAKFASRLAKR